MRPRTAANHGGATPDDVRALRPALRGDTPVMIQVSPLLLPETATELLTQVVRSGRLAQGPMVERFESGLRELVDTRHTVVVSSGTAALGATLEALGVGP